MVGGFFITFEGIDGSGKSTQAEMLKDMLGEHAHLVYDPGYDEACEDMRTLIFKHKDNLSYLSEVMLFASARNQLYNTEIKPVLDKGGIVISDRYLDSTTVYQGERVAKDPQKLAWLNTINEIATERRTPDLTFLINTSPVTAQYRLAERDIANTYDQRDLSYYQTLQVRYLDIAVKNLDRFTIIDGDRSIEAQHIMIAYSVLNALTFTDIKGIRIDSEIKEKVLETAHTITDNDRKYVE